PRCSRTPAFPRTFRSGRACRPSRPARRPWRRWRRCARTTPRRVRTRARSPNGAFAPRTSVRACSPTRGCEVARIVLAGYLIRNPLGGYAWQVAHYLAGLRALGHDAWFYEDTGPYALAYDPVANTFGPDYDPGVRAAAAFLGHLGLGERWVFVDVERGVEHGPGAGRAAALLREADLLVNVAGINRIPPDRRGGRPAVFIDIDPAFTQVKAAAGDALLPAILDEHDTHSPVRENIGTARSPIPTAGCGWHAEREAVGGEWWGVDRGT